ncbi:MAG: ABC transporter permease [Patulibacter minatonensis]
MEPAPLLSFDAVEAGYGGAPVLRGVDLELRRGEVLALLGPSGAGKSTLVQVAAGLLAPSGGTVRTTGRVAAALQGAALARRSVHANLDAALGWWGVPRPERVDRIHAALTACAAAHLADRPARALSGGEATRVHLARAVMLDPAVLLLDEPFAALDPVVRGELLADAGAVIRDGARATLVVVHDRAEAWALADRIAVLLDGRIAAVGPPAAVLEAPPTEAVAEFLGFSGRLTDPSGGVLRLRPAHVGLVAPGTGELDGVVQARIPEPDGLLVRVRNRAGHRRCARGAARPRAGGCRRSAGGRRCEVPRMSFVLHVLGEALRLIVAFDPALWATVARTLLLALASTAAAGAIGIPLGAWIGLRARRGPGGLLRAIGANVGLGLPPVVLGIFLGLLLLPGAPLGWLQWLDTIQGVWLAQVLLAAPLVTALTVAAVAQGPAALLDQAQALGAGRRDRLALLLAEVRPALLAALLAAALAGIGEVGAVIIIGGNISGQTNTLASTIVLELSAGETEAATASTLLLCLLVALLTWGLGRARRASTAPT